MIEPARRRDTSRYTLIHRVVPAARERVADWRACGRREAGHDHSSVEPTRQRYTNRRPPFEIARQDACERLLQLRPELCGGQWLLTFPDFGCEVARFAYAGRTKSPQRPAFEQTNIAKQSPRARRAAEGKVLCDALIIKRSQVGHNAQQRLGFAGEVC